MGSVSLPIDNVMVAFELPDEHSVLLARYLTAGNGKDRRVGRFIRNPRTYGEGVVTRRVHDLAERAEKTAGEMTEQMGVWLRCAHRDATGREPSAGAVAEWYLSGSIRGFAGTLPDLTNEQAREFKQAAQAVVGHECGKTQGCAVCLAGRRRRWDDLFKLTETNPELLVELYRGFLAAGYPGIPARTNPANPYEPDF